MQKELGEIIKGCLKKEAKAEYALYRECYSMLMGICHRYSRDEDDAAELLNKGFYKILTNLGSYQPEKPFDKWAKSVLINSIIDEFRSNKSNKQLFVQTDMTEAVYSHPLDFNTAENKMNIDDIIKHIQTLPPLSREVFNLYVFDGMSHNEIGEKLGLKEGTSRWHLNNARTILKTRLAAMLKPLKTIAI